MALRKYALVAFSTLLATGSIAETSESLSADDPPLATYAGHTITLRSLEEFVRELPVQMRVPPIPEAGNWREFACRELAKDVLFTSRAVSMEYHLTPAYRRAREYFIQEYLCYAVLRDNVFNRITVTPEKLEQYYATHADDFYVSPTVSLRVIRTRDAEKAGRAATRLASGEDFITVERELSEVSPRTLGKVVGPFPSPKAQATIPPPPEVIRAALQTDPGVTTGPMAVGPFYFLYKVERKTAGRRDALERVREIVEARIRDQQGEDLSRQLLAQMKKELRIAADEAKAESASTSPEDVIATVGAVQLTHREYHDLRGRVRGPARNLAESEPTRLRQFLVPLMLAESARAQGYLNKPDLHKALCYYDLLQLSEDVVGHEVEVAIREPSEGEIRAKYDEHIKEHAHTDHKNEPSYDRMRGDLVNALRQQAKPETEKRVVGERLKHAGFRMMPTPTCTRISAVEAIAAAENKLPKDSRLLEMFPAQDPGDEHPPTLITDLGRHESWRIVAAASESGATIETIVSGPSKLNDGSAQVIGGSLLHPWRALFGFDTDAVARRAVDSGISDFMIKHAEQVNVHTRVEFSYDNGKPADCIIVFDARPVDRSISDGLELRYSAKNSELWKRRSGPQADVCPTCPTPDKPVETTATTGAK